VFPHYADHPRPYLIGMALAVACARAFHAQVQWPNDVVSHGRKLGGILTEMLQSADGKPVPVVGVGVNLNQASFPEAIAHIATSVKQESGYNLAPQEALDWMLSCFSELPEARSWTELSDAWSRLDATEGKAYRLQDGRQGVAQGIDAAGALICEVSGQTEKVLAADAIFGRPS
jgi:BirA family biotin operon repressor/biotin-[acetyl-CoA-carboxylase] ligase